MSLILSVQLFLEAQGYKVTNNVIFQDNSSTMLLANTNPAARKPVTFEIRYYLITDNIKQNRARVWHIVPTMEMTRDFFTKPLQGVCALFR